MTQQELKTFEIWMEGYAATGESGRAQKIWEGLAVDFDHAVRLYQTISRDEVEIRPENTRSKYSIWACALFDNEADARKSFG
jgi:hypothetical protein